MLVAAAPTIAFVGLIPPIAPASVAAACVPIAPLCRRAVSVCAPVVPAPLVGVTALGAALVGTTLLGTALIGTTLLGTTLLGATFVRVTPLSASGVSASLVYMTPLLDNASICITSIRITSITVATDRERLRIASVPRARHVRWRPAHPILPQLHGLVAKDDPATIGMIIPAPIHQICRAPMVIGAGVVLDPRRHRLDVLGVIVVDQFAPRMREAPRQHRRERQHQPDRPQTLPQARNSIPHRILR
jgi:hypothetical protein